MTTLAAARRPAQPPPLFTPDMPFARFGLIINAAVPAAILLWDALHHQLGADPVNFAIHTTGFIALLFLLLSLTVTPLRSLPGFSWLLQFRRSLGLYAFFYACAHLAIYFWYDRAHNLGSTVYEITHRLYLIIGITALLLMAPLAATSFNAAVRALGGKKWKALHRLVYLSAILGCIHYYMQVKADTRKPLIMIAVLAVLLGYRVLLFIRHKTHPAMRTPAAAAGKARFWKGNLKVAAMTRETPTVRTFRLVPEDGGEIPFQFAAGQFLNLTLDIEGKPVRVPGANGAVQQAGLWGAYNPDGTGDEPRGYMRMTDGRLARLDNNVPQVLLPKLRVSHPAISYDTREVASVGNEGSTITVIDVAQGTSRVVLHAKLKGGRFSTPSWDTRGNVWAVESNSHGSRLWEIEGGTRTLNVDGWTLAPYPVKALRISRDGTRAAAIVQMGAASQVQLGRVDRAPTGGLQAEGFIAISSDIQGAVDLAWRDADHLAVIGVTASNPSPLLYDVPISGATVQPMVGPGSDMKSLAAYPGAPLLVMQHVASPQPLDNVCRLNDRFGEWRCFDRTADPAYPG